MKSRVIKIGTRGSKLALVQAEIVAKRLHEAHPDHTFQIIPIRTTGDRITSVAELRRAGKGIFVKEIERALLGRKITLAVHSMKDLPSELPEGLAIGAVLERADPSDAFIGRGSIPIEKLPPKAVVGTSSLRRQAILKSIFPHLVFVEMKGNVDTRLEKLRNPRSNLSGIVLAAAGIQRLYPGNGVPVQILPREKVVPAPGQGALGIEIRASDDDTRKFLEPVHHPPTAACVQAERELLRRLEGGCQVPLGAYAEPSDDGLLRLVACVASLDGRKVVRESQTGTLEDPARVAEALETILNSRGAREILDAIPRPGRAAKPHRNGNGRAKSRRRSRSRR